MEYLNSLIALVFLFRLTGISGLKDIQIKVPEAVRVGDTVTLTCDYDLEEVALYTIKWYHHEEEFYRYVPKESPPSKVFVMPFLDVDVYQSNSREVTLKDVQRETSGEFKCEVSADAPLFHTEIRTAHLLVAGNVKQIYFQLTTYVPSNPEWKLVYFVPLDVPFESPVLRMQVYKSSLHADIKANCTTPGSHPRMNVTWLINNSTSFPKHGVHIEENVNRYDALPGLVSVRSSISIRASQELFKNGKMRVACWATMFNLYNHSKEDSIDEDGQLLPLIMPNVSTYGGPPSRGFPYSSSVEPYYFNIYKYILVCLLLCNLALLK